MRGGSDSHRFVEELLLSTLYTTRKDRSSLVNTSPSTTSGTATPRWRTSRSWASSGGSSGSRIGCILRTRAAA